MQHGRAGTGVVNAGRRCLLLAALLVTPLALAVTAQPAGASTVSGSATGPARFVVHGGRSITPEAVRPRAVSTGYDMVGSDGGVFVFGQAGGFYGSLPALNIHVKNVVGMVGSADGRGYFLVGSDGGVFAFGDATFEGSLPGLGVKVNNIVGLVPSSDDLGYFLVGSDGGVFAFGDAVFEGSLPGAGVRTDSVVSIAGTPDNQGYWVLLNNGTIYNFGSAPNLGSLSCPAGYVCGKTVSLVSTYTGMGLWVVDNFGFVYTLGDAPYWGGRSASDNNGSPPTDITSIVPTSDDGGYLLVGADGGLFAFGDAVFHGSLPSLGITVSNIVGAVPTA